MGKIAGVELDALPKRQATDLRLLWVNDWYDGPLEAVVEHDGERQLMVLHDDHAPVDVEKPMRWVLFRLSPEQWTEEERWHALFEEHVGHHWCFHHDPAPEPTESQDARRFYEPYAKRTPRNLDAGAACGWVDEMPAK
jgi:hypothetical protein